ncbi:sensor histidine kinase [Sulfurimonas sp.]
MLHHEKTAFWKFFITYFLSVALLILAAGYFYFEQMTAQLLKAEHFSLIEYARHIKMNDTTQKFGDDFHYKFVNKGARHINISNFTITKNEFMKYIPMGYKKSYLQVFKSTKSFNTKLTQLQSKIIAIQIFLLVIFAYLSYLLARNALKPLQESIETLDKFAKDLIHDLNTPVTAMKLNIKLLEKQNIAKDSKALIRLKKSIETISELRENLTVLLEKKTFQVTSVNVCEIVKDITELHQPNYPEIHFYTTCTSLNVTAHKNALKQVLHNLISNACKYNKSDGFIKIYTQDNTLCIEDSGVGIKEPDLIFDREYSAQNSSGLGLDIVKRLCDAMNIKIEVQSSNEGSCFKLIFK